MTQRLTQWLVSTYWQLKFHILEYHFIFLIFKLLLKKYYSHSIIYEIVIEV